MRVIHADGIVGSHELIGEGFAWLDEVLGIRGDAILIVGRAPIIWGGNLAPIVSFLSLPNFAITPMVRSLKP